ncbi:PepSY-associated TM helix domain-containing protein [Limibacter armeniacum]|uniref:PepSY-associated TM helix domain-containing protein n=1 Tax=Limibacter armeniacum TaxID=466084 RepID=UPI002FE55098
MGKQKSKVRKVIDWLHLWPSLISSVIVIFVCLTGTIIVYGDEIMDFTAGDAKYVETVGEKRITSEEIDKNIKALYPKYMISEYVFFNDPKRSIRLRAFSREEKMLSMIYMDPYTGEILKKDNSIYFFFVTAHLHASFLAGEAGHWVVAISTIIFVISSITGLVLWWPKKWTKSTRQASFAIKWDAKFKRLNYDLHNVLGFYSLVLCLVLSVTGLIIFFPGLTNLTVKATGGDVAHLEEVLPKMDSTQVSLDMVPFAYKILEEEHPDKAEISTWNPSFQKIGAYVFTTGKVGLKSVENADISIFDRYSGEKITVDEKYLHHEKTENVVWQLHMGQWWGQFGKLSTFLTGLIATSLPITGFIIWWGRRKKKKPTKKKALAS